MRALRTHCSRLLCSLENGCMSLCSVQCLVTSPRSQHTAHAILNSPAVMSHAQSQQKFAKLISKKIVIYYSCYCSTNRWKFRL